MCAACRSDVLGFVEALLSSFIDQCLIGRSIWFNVKYWSLETEVFGRQKLVRRVSRYSKGMAVHQSAVFGLVTEVNDGEATTWVFPHKYFGTEEVLVNIRNDIPLSAGDWIKLGQSSNVFEYTLIEEERAPLSVTKYKDYFEVKSKAVLIPKEGQCSPSLAWTPDFGKVLFCRILKDNEESRIYELSLIRLRNLKAVFGMDISWAVSGDCRLEYVSQFVDSAKDRTVRKALHKGVVVEEKPSCWMIWSKSGGLAFIEKTSITDKFELGTWVTYCHRLPKVESGPIKVSRYEKAAPLYASRVVNGHLALNLNSSRSVIRRESERCSMFDTASIEVSDGFIGRIFALNLWVIWTGLSWRIDPSLSVANDDNPGRIGVVVQGKNENNDLLSLEEKYSHELKQCERYSTELLYIVT
ncbi:hypothetical protein AB6A40_008624 [Gnathostoma spinigerum]|uniref:Uncharacterized protein n=1 Tax=Gnathostoma spinigerum TaxID=75299 RepID=A0ABD6EZX7_9BILA